MGFIMIHEAVKLSSSNSRDILAAPAISAHTGQLARIITKNDVLL